MTKKDRIRKRVIDTEEPAPVPLEIAPEHVEFIILKARAFEAAVSPVEPGGEPEPGLAPPDDEEAGIVEALPGDQTADELREAIAGLSGEAAIDLLALFWVGSGDFSREEWAEARAQAAEQIGEQVSDTLPAYLMGEADLGDMLEEGLNTLGYEPETLSPDA